MHTLLYSEACMLAHPQCSLRPPTPQLGRQHRGWTDLTGSAPQRGSRHSQPPAASPSPSSTRHSADASDCPSCPPAPPPSPACAARQWPSVSPGSQQRAGSKEQAIPARYTILFRYTVFTVQNSFQIIMAQSCLCSKGRAAGSVIHICWLNGRPASTSHGRRIRGQGCNAMLVWNSPLFSSSAWDSVQPGGSRTACSYRPSRGDAHAPSCLSELPNESSSCTYLGDVVGALWLSTCYDAHDP
jgi:hypothetical protein